MPPKFKCWGKRIENSNPKKKKKKIPGTCLGWARIGYQAAQNKPTPKGVEPKLKKKNTDSNYHKLTLGFHKNIPC